MIKLARRLLLPLLLVNITTAANDWHLLGVSLGGLFFWIVIGVSAYLVLHSPYRAVGGGAVVAAFLFRVLEAATHDPAITALRHGALALLLMTAGASAYGRYPRLLARQFALFMALSLPIMLLQVTGAHSYFMTWDVDYAHDPAILSHEEIGTFKQIPVYPTLFVEQQDLRYQIGQGRPSGLLYANNVLSVFVTIAAGLALATARRSRVGVSGVIVLAVLVLTMSMTAFLAVALFYGAVFVIGERRHRRYVLKAVCVTGALVWTYAYVFPGLFATAFSREKMLVRMFTRGLGLFDMVGISFLRRMYDWNGAYMWGIIEPDTTYSGVEKMLRSPLAGVSIALAIVVLVWYWRGLSTLRRASDPSWLVYPVTALACVLTQFGVPYYGAPSFQCIFGFAMFPIFQRLWPARSAPRAVTEPGQPVPATS